MESTEATKGIEQAATDTQQSVENSQPNSPMFQAVGVIVGEVTFSEDRATIAIGSKKYPLLYISSKKKGYEGLKKEIETSGISNQRLIVYPKFTHFPRKEQPPHVAFQLVGFDKKRKGEAISEQLFDMEFKLCGLWQFIPVCKTPCISVFRNFSEQRLDYIKQAEPAKKVKFMKSSHLPLIWRDAPVPPFRFNPKAEKEEQGRPVFVQIKAKFLPHRDVFGFDSLLAIPEEKAPKFLKASKEEKATALSQKRDKRDSDTTAAASATNQLSPKPKPKPNKRTQ
ncbi:hypothetical protein [Fischerella sp. PCC 9605]|uniref:hypothetical protein n=1 Tax=Fischerella sp. PCC 9605 TaxID=1173024 RepID=UPI0004B43156|nr:hypothetical protein [Fischerella sp. PCC 9605]